MADLKAIDADVDGALEHVRVPSYIIDRHGIIRWANAAAQTVAGDVQGRQFTSVLAPEERRRGREIFTRNLFGPPQGSDNHVVIEVDGERIEVEVSAVPLLRGGHVIGVFGQAKHVGDEPAQQPMPSLTPRQTEVLHLLEQGLSTAQIADTMHLSTETVRNHVRRLLSSLGVHSRLEAVALAHHAHQA